MHLLRFTAVLIGTAAVLPAVARTETSPTIEAINKPGSGAYAEERHAWSPQQASVPAGGAVRFANPSSVPHGVRWVSTPATPACSGVPEAGSSSAFGIKWSGSCTFAAPGTYTFYCTVHGPEMTGTVFVSAPGAPASTQPGSPLAGSPTEAVKVSSKQRGKAVRGSIAISSAGSGAKLRIDLLAKSAALAGADPTPVRVGKLVRFGLQPGELSFSVPLSARARGALRRHHRLALSVRILVSYASAPGAVVTRSVLMRP